MTQEIKKLIELLTEISLMKYDDVIITGDFNYKEVDWKKRRVNASTTHPASKIFDKLNDMFLEQLIHEATRYRAGEQANTLDWVITNEPDLINDIQLKAPLGEKGDHCVIIFLT